MLCVEKSCINYLLKIAVWVAKTGLPTLYAQGCEFDPGPSRWIFTMQKMNGVHVIVRVQYFVRGGFVGHRSRVSSKHLFSLIFRPTVFDSSGVKKGLRCSCKMHVWVSGPTKMPTTFDVRRSDVTALALSYRTFPLRKG
ncbi:hypothetical protein TNCV_2555861 [Trichonephila clavipes]|nr:hypothetical protein TNCV_2555861 [Trichonephila clavipes]